ncbi:LysM domain-containing protein [Micrococcus sp.]|uniref:LysM peptidoglycan-binding domain-containing protein n=1 Tax=Micrococcus sp. TaxID=1271 RepID=UPI0026DB2767|nr:LysM domain-containing protein [Micrococcus sp.]MDO4240300.1 LysM domain-containing protein [Micrococcus sp.]
MGLLRRLLTGSDDEGPGLDVLSGRLENAPAIAEAARRAGVPLSVAAALAEVESGGRNVFGNDRGGVFSRPGRPDVPVTPERVAELRRRVADGETSNGIGPAQITWPPFFDRADEAGLDLADPEDNLTLGLTILAEHARGDLSPAGLERAGTLYNAGTLAGGVTAYGRRLARAAAAWEERLTGRPPAPSEAAGPSGAGDERASTGTGRTHVVRAGETLWGIAREQGTDVATLRRLNPGIVPERMAVGTPVRLP